MCECRFCYVGHSFDLDILDLLLALALVMVLPICLVVNVLPFVYMSWTAGAT